MSKQFTETKQEKDEFSNIFNDYRSKLDEITRQMQKNLGFELPEPDPPAPKTEDIVVEVQTQAELEPEEMFAQVREELEIKEEFEPVSEKQETDVEPAAVSEISETNIQLIPVSGIQETDTNLIPVSGIQETNIEPVQVPEKPEPVIVKESEEIIREAKRQASRIITEAEKRIKNEAKKKTESQVNKIITQAQKEAKDIISRARQHTDEQKNEALNALKQQAQQSIDEILENCRRETYEQSSQILSQSREKATKMIGDILAAGKEINLLLEEAITSAGNTINDFESRIKTGNETLLKAISQSQSKFLQITMAADEEKAKEEKAKERTPEAEPQNKHKETKNTPALSIHLLDNNSDTDGEGLFRGKIEVKSASAAVDYTYLKNLKKYLISLPAVKYLQGSASEKAVTMLFEISDPLPILDVLHHIPSIDDVISETNDSIRLTFKTSDHL